MAYERADITVRDVRIRTHRGGQGEPMVFLHGANGASAWLPFFDSLSRHYDLIVPEHPGFGASDDPKWIRTVPDIAMFYLDLLDQTGLAGVHLVGHSLGGWIAAEIAVRNASRLKSLTLIAPAGIRIKGMPPGDNFIWSPEEQVRNLFHDGALGERLLGAPATEEDADALLRNRFAAAKYGWQPRWLNPDLEKWLHRIKVPALVAWGDADRLLPPAYAELWRQRLADARVALVEDAGHLPHVEKPDRVFGHLRQFLDEVSA